MEIRCLPQDLTAALGSWSDQALAVGLFAGGEDAPADHPLLQALTDRYGPELLARLAQRRFKGQLGDAACLELLGELPGSVILVGLGDPASFAISSLRAAAASAATTALAAGCTSLGLALPLDGIEDATAAAAPAPRVASPWPAAGWAGPRSRHWRCAPS